MSIIKNDKRKEVFYQIDLVHVIRRISRKNKETLFIVLEEMLKEKNEFVEKENENQKKKNNESKLNKNEKNSNNQQKNNMINEKTRKNFTIYTDGACSGNPGPGGWAWIRKIDDDIEESQSGRIENTTNNKAEYIAIFEAIKSVPENSNVKIYSDSKVAVSWFRGAALKAQQEIFDLYLQMEKIIKQKNLKIEIEWKEKNKDNMAHVRADILAKKCAGSKIR